MENEKLIKSMETLLSTTFIYYTKTHSFHFNVEGPSFVSLHKLFGDIYTDVYNSIDPLAEEIRVLDCYVPFSLSEMLEKTKIKEQQGTPSDGRMVKELLSDTDTLIKSLDETLKLSLSSNKQGLSNRLSDRIDQMGKWRWQLQAILRG